MNVFYGAAAAAFLLIASFGAGWHFGGQSGKLADTAHVAQQEAGVIKQTASDTAQINDEAKHYADAQLVPVSAPAVSLCHYTPAAVPRAAAAGPLPHAAAELPAANPPNPVPGPDIGRPLVSIGRDANAQVAALQDYINHVCRVPAP